MYRTHLLNSLTAKDVGQKVKLAGWVNRRRDHGGLIFIDMRDREGLTQIVLDPKKTPKAHKQAEKIRPEFVIQAEGKVRKRPKGMKNPKLKTGEIEVLCDQIKILNPSKTPPFPVANLIDAPEKEINEELRLRYRYLDLRRQRLKNNLIIRHKTSQIIRNYMDKKGFLEIETAILIKGTPEGSREYLVPSRLYPGHFYVLPQSPQQLKQLLMVAGIDKYFQLPRCFRDEDQRGDRQPEFTQLDMEMSFVEEKDIMDLNDGLMVELLKKIVPHKKILNQPFPRIPWQEAMEKYGSDKPDLRFKMEITDFTDLAAKCQFKIFQDTVKNKGVVKALKVDDGACFSRKIIDELTALAQVYGGKGLAYLTVGDKGAEGAIAKFFKPAELQNILKKTNAKKGDIIFFAADEFETACTILGQIRLSCADKFNLRNKDELALCWVIDFPLFEWSKEHNCLTSAHHPFTHPKDEDIPLLAKKPEKVLAKAYDFVMNGCEIGGGSIRIHDAELQGKIFDTLKISKEEAQKRFGHLMDAFSYGAPPHGGIAWGLDRVVMLLCDEDNIREVIAYPKDQTAKDLMMGAPSELPKPQVDEMHIAIKDVYKESVLDQVIKLLKLNHVHFEPLKHQAVYTSEEAAKTRGTTLKQGARALVMKTADNYILTVTSGEDEVDLKKLKSFLGTDTLELAKAKEVKAKTNCEPGAVTPFGNIFGLPTYVDKKLLNNDEIAFNAGTNCDSIKMKAQDWAKVVMPEVGDFT